MNKKEAKKKIENLRKIIKYHAKKYYDEDNPEISDFEYDMLGVELKNLENQFPDLISEDSPSQKLAASVKEGFEKYKHKVPLQSLQDIFSFEELVEFDERIKKQEDEFRNPLKYSVEAKIDGLSVSLEYEKGVFIRGTTRGDGTVGEVITENLRTIKTIPTKLTKPINIIVRGEVFISKKDFEKLNNEREVLEEPLFANARNAAAGSLRQLDSTITAGRKLDIYVFNIQKIEDEQIDSHSVGLNYLKELGFNVIPVRKLCKNIDEAIGYIKEIGEKREDLSFNIDGAVVKVDDINSREVLGTNFKTPKWAIAYKYPPEQKETILKDIICQVGRTGVITPMAILEPVRVAGSLISKTTLHNEDFIKEKDLKIGDTIVIQKAGDVIPEVVKVITKKRNGTEKKFSMPKKCPVCGADAIREEGEAAVRCIGIECSARNFRSLVHFASKDCMNIDGLGLSIIEQLLDRKLIENISDIYYLKLEDIASLKKDGTKFAENLINAINESKKNDLSRLINSLGIRQVGTKLAKTLAKKYKNIDDLMKAEVEELSVIGDVGEITAKSIYTFFRQEQSIDLINKLKSAGINTKNLQEESSDNRFDGMTFVLTGTLEKYSRDEASEIIEKFGGKTSSSVSKKTSYVLAGADAGSKLTKAHELGIMIINEQEFEDLIS